MGLRAEEVVVPDAEQRHEHGKVALEGRGAEVLVDRAEAGQEFVEVLRADGRHQREPDGGVDAVTTADPIPESEHVGGVDAEGLDLVGVGRHRDEVVAHGIGRTDPAHQPLARGLGVGHRLDRRERLGRDDEQRLLGVEVAGRLPDIGAVDVGHEAHLEPAIAVVAQRLVTHGRDRGRCRRCRC